MKREEVKVQLLTVHLGEVTQGPHGPVLGLGGVVLLQQTQDRLKRPVEKSRPSLVMVNHTHPGLPCISHTSWFTMYKSHILVYHLQVTYPRLASICYMFWLGICKSHVIIYLLQFTFICHCYTSSFVTVTHPHLSLSYILF